jgi:uncharacterized membrane protein
MLAESDSGARIRPESSTVDPMLSVRGSVRIGLAAVLAIAGIAHFVAPRPFIGHIPAVVPMRGELVAISGAVEVLLAAGLVGPRRWRRPAGTASALYLLLVFPGNAYAAISQVPIEGVPTGWVRWARLPLQVPLILAAWWSTRSG